MLRVGAVPIKSAGLVTFIVKETTHVDHAPATGLMSSAAAVTTIVLRNNPAVLAALVEAGLATDIYGKVRLPLAAGPN